jgi:branched-chain amino acid transport system ATP-binding protein
MAVVRTLADAMPSTQEPVPEDRPLLSFQDVELSFGALTALDSVSFEVQPKELFSIIGPNGAGKTSIFNCISGVYHPQVGDIRFLDKDVRRMKPHAIAELGIARTFQNIELFENLTVLENIALGRHQHVAYNWTQGMFWAGRAHREEVEHRAVVEDIIDFLEIEQHRKSIVGMLPYGVQKRVELGRALAMEPKLLLLDEPVAGMNLDETADMARFILDIREELDIAILLVEHDMGVVMDLADRVLVLDFGKVIACDVPAVVQEDPEVIRAYLGEEEESVTA